MKKICFFLFILCAFESNAQTKTADSLKIVLQSAKEDSVKIKALHNLAWIYRSNDPDTAIYFANEMMALSQKNNDTKGVINAYMIKGIAKKNIGEFEDALKNNNYALGLCNKLLASAEVLDKVSILKLKAGAYSNIGNIYEEKGNYTEALKNDFSALQIKKEVGEDPVLLAALYNNIGNVYAEQGNTAEALKNLFAGLRLKEKTGNKKSLANSYDGIGSVYYSQKEYIQALKYHKIALKLRQQVEDKAGITSSYNNIGIIYDDEGNYTEALKYHFASLNIEKEIGDQQGVALSYNNIGLVFMHQGKNDGALKYFLNYLKISEELEDTAGITNASINVGKVYVQMNNNTAAAPYLNKGLLLAKQIGGIDVIKEAYLALATLDSAKNNFGQSLLHYKLYINYRDSLFNKENTKKLVEAQMQYDFDKKDAVSKAQQDKKDAEAKRIKNQQIFTILALAVVVLAVVIIAIIQFRNNKHKQKANTLLQIEKQKVETALSELKSTQAQLIQSEKMASLGELTAGIAHEIQNPLNFVNNFSEVNKELLEELKDEAGKGNIDEVKSIANDVIENSEKINYHGKRADAIVKGMLQHSRKSEGKKELADINALCDEYLRLSYHGLRAKDKEFNADFKTDFDETIGKINIIPQDIGRVLLNLFNNAFYAVSKPSNSLKGEQYKPLISVTTRKISSTSGVGGIEIIVKDNGNGIPQNLVEKIFQPFFTTKPTGQGTGLGLSLSYDIIKAHGGEIKVETKESEGSEFIIQLPI